VWPSSSLSGMSSLPYSAETQWASSFWPLRPLVQRAVATLRPMCFCTIEDGWCVCPDCVERELGSTTVVTPVAVEAWTSSWWNDRGHVGS
jgi:hypothetical protein